MSMDPTRNQLQYHTYGTLDLPTVISFILGIDESNDVMLEVIYRWVLAMARDTHSIQTFDCQSDVRNPGQKSTFFEVESDQIAHNIML